MMFKDFDSWNIQKKYIDQNNINKFYRPREIWWCSLGVNIGFEQDGTGKEYERPAVILKAFSKHVCLIVPLTTSEKKNKYHVSVGLVNTRPAFVIISQIKLIDTKRFINKIGMVDSETFDLIRNAVKAML